MKRIPQEKEINNSNMANSDILFHLLREEGFRRVCRALEHAIGTAEASLYSELLGRRDYFRKRGQLDDEGYFFNTVLDLQHGTALTDYQQRRAIKRLEQLSLIITRLKDSPPKRYFKINGDSSVLNGYLLQGQAIMEELEQLKESQKKRIENERERKEGYFSPKNLKSKVCSDLKSKVCSDSNLKELQTKKNKVNKNKKREPLSTSSHLKDKKQVVNEVVESFKSDYIETYKTTPAVKSADKNILITLIDEHDQETIREALTLHVKEPDNWTKERGSSLGTFKHNLPGYIETIRQRKEAAEIEQRRQEANQRREEEERKKEEELARERAEYEALPEVEKARKKYNDFIEIRKPLKESLQKKAAEGDQYSIDMLKEYENKESELLQRYEQLK